jgi:hypothetical protein
MSDKLLPIAHTLLCGKTNIGKGCRGDQVAYRMSPARLAAFSFELSAGGAVPPRP